MINSTACPLCQNGVGHKVDDDHAERVDALLTFIKTLAREPCYDLPGEYPEDGEDGQLPCTSCQAKEILKSAVKKQ